MAAERTSEWVSFRRPAMAGMVIRTSSRNSATNTLEHTHRKVMLTHTLHCQRWKELDGCRANVRMSVLQTSSNGRNGDPNVLPKFSYKHAWAHPPESDVNTYPALPALKGARWLPSEHPNQNASDDRQWQEWWSERPPEIQLQTRLSTPTGKW